MNLARITDPADERLADFAALNDPALRKRYEHDLGVFIAEGPNVVRELLASDYPVRSILVVEAQLESMADALTGRDLPVYVVARDLLYDLVRFKLHQGVLGCGLRLPPADLDPVLADARNVAVFEGLNDHENLGTLFRSARGLGIDAVLLAPGCADPLYRRSVRVSMGHVLHVPFAWAPQAALLLPRLHAAGFETLALTPRVDAIDLAEWRPAEDRTALLLGAEGPGLTPDAVHGAVRAVRIPMQEGVDSLNVAAAGAIAFHALAVARSSRPDG